MAMLNFDSYKMIAMLRGKGFTEEKAVGVKEAIESLDMDHFATKQDLKETERLLRSDIKKLETDLRTDMRELEHRMTTRLGGMMVIAIGLVATLVKIL